MYDLCTKDKGRRRMDSIWHEVCGNTKKLNIMKQFVLIVLAAMVSLGSAEACLNKAKVENLEVKGERLEAKGDDLKWEVDVFHGRLEGRVLAEIELSDEDEAFERPDWLGEEVTGQPQYYNANM